MSEAVITAIISGILSLIGVIITVVSAVKKSRDEMIVEIRRRSDDSDAKLDKEIALLRAEVDELMREVRIHNNFAVRMPVVEQQIDTINEEIKELRRHNNNEG